MLPARNAKVLRRGSNEAPPDGDMNDSDQSAGDGNLMVPLWTPSPSGDGAAAGLGRRRRQKRERAPVVLARATIPSAIVLAVLLPAMGIGWFLLPGDAPLKVGEAPMAIGLAASGPVFALAAAILMRFVAKRLHARP
jgi:hypothetical protein